MNIVLGDQAIESLRDRYIVLSLDSFLVSDRSDPVTSYCVIEQIPLEEMANIDNWRSLHENLMINYAKQNWAFCEQAIEHLFGKWSSSLDSFYSDLLLRVQSRKTHDFDPNWSPIIDRRAQDNA